MSFKVDDSVKVYDHYSKLTSQKDENSYLGRFWLHENGKITTKSCISKFLSTFFLTRACFKRCMKTDLKKVGVNIAQAMQDNAKKRLAILKTFPVRENSASTSTDPAYVKKVKDAIKKDRTLLRELHLKDYKASLVYHRFTAYQYRNSTGPEKQQAGQNCFHAERVLEFFEQMNDAINNDFEQSLIDPIVSKFNSEKSKIVLIK